MLFRAPREMKPLDGFARALANVRSMHASNVARAIGAAKLT